MRFLIIIIISYPTTEITLIALTKSQENEMWGIFPEKA